MGDIGTFTSLKCWGVVDRPDRRYIVAPNKYRTKPEVVTILRGVTKTPSEGGVEYLNLLVQHDNGALHINPLAAGVSMHSLAVQGNDEAAALAIRNCDVPDDVRSSLFVIDRSAVCFAMVVLVKEDA